MTVTARRDEGLLTSTRDSVPDPVRVLVVDDCADAADSLALLLSISGCAVGVAYSGAEAVVLARTFHPHLVLSELALPDGEAHDLPKMLGGSDHPLLVALAGLGTDDDRRRARRAGFDRYLLKPVSPDDLLELVAVVEYSKDHASGG